MGKAAVELPDPLDTPLTGANGVAAAGASADDLLAQMAGEEIDRLLTEAGSRADVDSSPLLVQVPPDVRHSTSAAVPPPPPAPLAAADTPTEVAATPIASAGISPADQPRAEEAASPAPANDAGLSQQLDDLFNQLAKEEPRPAAVPAASPEPAAGPAASVAAAAAEQAAPVQLPPQAAPVQTALVPTTPPVAPPPPEEPVAIPPSKPAPVAAPSDLGTSLLERSALKAIQPSVAAALQKDAAKADERPPLWMLPLVGLTKLLEWVNAPLAACPDRTRNVMGRIALLTLLNALGVLVYVLFFRKGAH